ncbi:MAG TPA: hypothetical protein DEB31_00820, partial [Clostridiales bacterium]|nr:hypothetical protein [Clostridiales bacterium]
GDGTGTGEDPGAEGADGTDGESSGSSVTVLQHEDESDAVEALQQKLKELGYLDKVTGYYGTDTVAAVEAFQENNDLEVDGIAGSGTQAKLDSDDAKAKDA